MKKCPFPSDETLLRQIREESPDAGFQTLLEKYDAAQRLQSYLRNLGANYSDVQDLYQDTMMAFFKHLNTEYFSVWYEGCLLSNLYRIAHHVWCSAYRRRKIQLGLFMPVDDMERQFPDLSDQTAAEEEIRSEWGAVAMACFQNLGAKSQALIGGYYLEGRKYEDLAAELYQSKDLYVAKQRSYIIRQNLRKQVLRKMAA